MLQEKVMVSDTLAGINAQLGSFGNMIAETGCPELKQTLKQIRNQCEASQEEIYQLARAKQYYIPAAPAKPDEIAHVRNILSQG